MTRREHNETKKMGNEPNGRSNEAAASRLAMMRFSLPCLRCMTAALSGGAGR